MPFIHYYLHPNIHTEIYDPFILRTVVLGELHNAALAAHTVFMSKIFGNTFSLMHLVGIYCFNSIVFKFNNSVRMV